MVVLDMIVAGWDGKSCRDGCLKRSLQTKGSIPRKTDTAFALAFDSCSGIVNMNKAPLVTPSRTCLCTHLIHATGIQGSVPGCEATLHLQAGRMCDTGHSSLGAWEELASPAERCANRDHHCKTRLSLPVIAKANHFLLNIFP